MPDIRLENLSFAFKKKKENIPVLKDVSITFESNKIHVILGKSGAGKTTLLRCINGLNDYEGHVYYNDLLVDQVPVKDRKVGYVSQEFALYPHFNLFRSIGYPLMMSGAGVDEIRKRVYEIANEFGIEHLLSRKPRQVSIGQAQRAVLARALVKRPYICLLDEPLSNVDTLNKQDLRRFIKESIKRNDCTCLYVTHDLMDATAIGDFIYLLDEGKIIAKGEPKEIIKSQNKEIREFFDSLKNETI